MTDGIIDGAQPLLDEIASRLDGDGRTVAVAESLTAGKIASHLGAAQDASTWFAGGVVAYTNETKYSVLNVDRGPVVTATCAGQMADGVAELLAADVAVAVTGVGGPGPEEGKEAGTVYVGGRAGARSLTAELHLDGGPTEVVEATTLHALRMLVDLVRGS
ncbi:CinA family protein [Georgenia daeguensis]|uniref:CinA C-terminal domain-containing protein n=1 Tax=Georgenia daeguensis TaxID=908355 RepID=A0ABP8EQM9_9MICO